MVSVFQYSLQTKVIISTLVLQRGGKLIFKTLYRQRKKNIVKLNKFGLGQKACY